MLESTNTIDFIVRADDGGIELILADGWDWSDEKMHLALLQDKVNRYFDYADSGEAHRYFGCENIRTRVPIRIRMIAGCCPTSEGDRFLRELAEVASSAGIGFVFEVLE